MKTFLLILLLAIPVYSQSWENFEYIGATKHENGDITGFFVDVKTPSVKGSVVSFDGLMARMMLAEVDKDNYLVTRFKGQCSTRRFHLVSISGKVGGRSVSHVYPAAEMKPSKPGTPIAAAIDRVCYLALGVPV